MSDREMFRGDNAEFALSVVRNGAPVDLTGAKVWMTARRSYGSPVIFSKTSDPDEGIEVVFAEGGLATVTTSNLDTAELASEEITLIYDVQVLDPTGRISTVETGTILVKPDATTDVE